MSGVEISLLPRLWRKGNKATVIDTFGEKWQQGYRYWHVWWEVATRLPLLTCLMRSGNKAIVIDTFGEKW